MSDRRAEFAEYVAARRPHLRRVAFGLTGSWEDAEDLTQAALAKLYVAWPRLRKAGVEDAYARRILVRLAVDHSRRPARRETPGLESYDAAAPAQGDPDLRRDLMAGLTTLPRMQRRSVILRYWVGLSVEETAHALGISGGTVKSHCARGLQHLHDLLATEEGARP